MQSSSLTDFDVAVVVPVYNAALYLRRCLDSVVRQQNVRLRVLIINDGSHDECKNIIEEYTCAFSHFISAFHTPNRGTGPSRNLALSHILSGLTDEATENTYVSFVDADDWLEQDALGALLAEARHSGSDIVLSDHVIHRSDERSLVRGFWGDSLTNPRSRLNNGNVFTVWAKLFKLRLFRQHRFPDLVHEDVALTPIIVRTARNVGYIQRALYNYSFRKDSKTGCGDFYLKPDILTAIHFLLQYALNKSDDVLLEFVMRYYCDILVEYKHKQITHYADFEQLNDRVLRSMTLPALQRFLDYAISRIQQYSAISDIAEG